MTTENPFGYIKEGKVYRNAFLEFEALAIGEVQETEEAAMEYFQDRFKMVEEKTLQLEKEINEAQNKGSYLGKLLNLKETFSSFEALGDFESIYRRLFLMEEQLNGYIAVNRAKNLEIKKALLEELKLAAQSSEWKSATMAVREIQNKWVRTGGVEKAMKSEVEATYEALIKAFYDRRQEFYSDLDKMQGEREELYAEFLKKAESLRSVDGLDPLRNEIRALKEEWKSLGRIRKSKRDEFWEGFQTIIQESLDAAKKKQKASRKSSSKENLQKRKDFLARLKQIAEDAEASPNVDQLKKEWSGLGSIAKKEMEALRDEYGFHLLVISERNFLNNLLERKAKKNASDKERRQLKMRLIRDLLDRDRRELNTFQENLEKFNTSSGLDKLIGGKLELQQRKVKAKQMIVDQLRKSNDSGNPPKANKKEQKATTTKSKQ